MLFRRSFAAFASIGLLGYLTDTVVASQEPCDVNLGSELGQSLPTGATHMGGSGSGGGGGGGGRRTLRVGVVGAGISGAATVARLRELAPPSVDLDIVVYEASDRVGGRVFVTDVEGQVVEGGGAVFHAVNKNMFEYAHRLNLTTSLVDLGRLAIWNGNQVVFEESHFMAVSAVAALYRYGLSPIYAKRATDACVANFLKLYPALQSGQGFTSVDDVLDFIKARELAEASLSEYLAKQWVKPRFVNEIAGAINMVNYGQTSEQLNGFVGLVSLVGGEPEVYAVDGGNVRIIEGLLKGADVRVNTPVVRIEEREDGSAVVVVSRKKGTAEETSEVFDGVVLATPLELSGGLQLGGSIRSVPRDRPWKTTHVTFVTGEVNATYFGLAPSSSGPSFYASVGDDTLSVRSVAQVSVTPTGKKIFKIFTEEPVTEALLDAVFIEHGSPKAFDIKAYPKLVPLKAEVAPSFVLSKRVFYANALESAVSTMETQTLAAINVANLLAKTLFGGEDLKST